MSKKAINHLAKLVWLNRMSLAQVKGDFGMEVAFMVYYAGMNPNWIMPKWNRKVR